MLLRIIGFILSGVCGLDLIVFFIGGLTRIPTSFTEWLCYPFWPLVKNGFSMFTSIIIRFIEIICLVVGVVCIVLSSTSAP